jgi:hypothetical protein
MHSGTAHAPCSMPMEVSSMGAMGVRRRLVLPAWAGFVLVVMGVLVFVASYFLLPVIADQCADACGWLYPTTWQLSLYGLSAWEYEVNALPQFDISLVPDTVLLVLYYPPLLAAVTVVGCSVGFLVRPHRTLVTWSHRAWLTGSIALVLMLLFVLFGASFFGGGPYSGFLGLLVGYGLLWGGNRVFRNTVPVT